MKAYETAHAALLAYAGATDARPTRNARRAVELANNAYITGRAKVFGRSGFAFRGTARAAQGVAAEGLDVYRLPLEGDDAWAVVVPRYRGSKA